MTNRIIKELITYLNQRHFEVNLDAAWKQVPKYTGDYCGTTLVSPGENTKIDEKFDKELIQAKKELELMLDFTQGE